MIDRKIASYLQVRVELVSYAGNTIWINRQK